MSNKFNIHEDMAFVSMDGDYGQGIIVFDPDLLTEEQWDNMTELHDNDRAVYVAAILQNDTTVIEEIEADIDEV